MSQKLLRILEVSRDITASQAVYDPLMHLDLMPVKAKVVNADPIRFKSMFMLGGLWLAHRYVLQVEGPNESF